ncbi:hypothetical protein BV898_06895 [Hypsibius exemplaris]|uniref:Putative auto-transporter adhesin head GIN domain-containing protein n=1 Tax=Hypsibius exemplaris TaxID=2072580 RepID=A0A1W0WV03_HYPEX|nr:hypothetical protein BV898_06895 [Hypsibius exemplaris]
MEVLSPFPLFLLSITVLSQITVISSESILPDLAARIGLNRPSSNFVVENRAISGFSRHISINGPFDVIIRLGGSESITLSALPETLSKIVTDVQENSLDVHLKDVETNVNSHDEAQIVITAVSLSKFVLAGTAHVRVDAAVKGEQLSIVLLNDARMQVVGLEPKETLNITITNSAAFQGVINNGKALNLRASGQAKLILLGSVEKADLNVQDLAQLNGENFNAQTIQAALSGHAVAILHGLGQTDVQIEDFAIGSWLCPDKASVKLAGFAGFNGRGLTVRTAEMSVTEHGQGIFHVEKAASGAVADFAAVQIAALKGAANEVMKTEDGHATIKWDEL